MYIYIYIYIYNYIDCNCFLSVIILVQSYFTLACGGGSALQVHSYKYMIVVNNKILIDRLYHNIRMTLYNAFNKRTL